MHHGLFVIPNCNPGHIFIIKHTSPKDMKKIIETKMHLEVQGHNAEIQKYLTNLWITVTLMQENKDYLLVCKTCRRGRKVGMCGKC